MSWVKYNEESPFPIQNLPYGVFHKNGEDPSTARCGVAIGDQILDLKVLQDLGLVLKTSKCFSSPSLNEFMSLGRKIWQQVRTELTELLSTSSPTIRDNQDLRKNALINQSDAILHLPARIGDYTDFYASIDHATNMGKIIRPNEEPLKPNWKWLPVGYHGRASSIVISGTPIRRPNGQLNPPNSPTPSYGPSRRLDYELEMAFFIGPGNELGNPITIGHTKDQIFGAVLMNDWSARDVQAWEYIPLGPFNGKNLGTTISPWIVPIDALEPFKVQGAKQDPEPLGYLKENEPSHYNIQLQVLIKTPNMTSGEVVATSNAKHLYWSWNQMVAHHTSTGCNLRPGDLLATGTISGPDASSYGSIMELSWAGQKPFKFSNGDTRGWLEDGDEVTLTGYCQGTGYRVGFGSAVGKVLPAHSLE
eukprot:TRINITY_DN9360_c0_g1_i1.p1 TRINITY_DN9360_c0_g1~~TRINITY_DN9360_c0_g1_i1.p1  ORF type:complete len:419 (+),score=74.96 TRINITY_DN9360_c0_g1_i1:89-1345(+)